MALADFIERYMKEHDLSARKFAANCGLNHRSINLILDRKEEGREIKIETIHKIANYTGANFYSLIKMAYPDFIPEGELSGEAEIVAQGFENASPEIKDIIRKLVATTDLHR